MDDLLYQRLSDLGLDDPNSAFRFSQRLARDNGWSAHYSGRVVAEYKRFLYLAARAGHPVTPSDQVDQVWHLHLCYTELYWDDLCQDTLGFPLHHGPTKGGSDERNKFNDWYARTLESYEAHFAEQPPADIWPAAKERFSRINFRRVDTDSHWVIPKKAVWLAGSIALIGAITVGCADRLTGANPIVLLISAFAVLVLTAVIFRSIKAAKSKADGSGCGAGGHGGGNASGHVDLDSSDGGGSDGGSGCGGGCGGCGG